MNSNTFFKCLGFMAFGFIQQANAEFRQITKVPQNPKELNQMIAENRELSKAAIAENKKYFSYWQKVYCIQDNCPASFQVNSGHWAYFSSRNYFQSYNYIDNEIQSMLKDFKAPDMAGSNVGYHVSFNNKKRLEDLVAATSMKIELLKDERQDLESLKEKCINNGERACIKVVRDGISGEYVNSGVSGNNYEQYLDSGLYDQLETLINKTRDFYKSISGVNNACSSVDDLTAYNHPGLDGIVHIVTLGMKGDTFEGLTKANEPAARKQIQDVEKKLLEIYNIPSNKVSGLANELLVAYKKGERRSCETAFTGRGLPLEIIQRSFSTNALSELRGTESAQEINMKIENLMDIQKSMTQAKYSMKSPYAGKKKELEQEIKSFTSRICELGKFRCK